MKAGYASVLGVYERVCGCKVLDGQFESHEHLWKTHQLLEIYQAGLLICTLDTDKCTYQKTKSIFAWGSSRVPHATQKMIFAAKSKSSLFAMSFGSHSFSCCCISELIRFNQVK